jgi:hypothetical protein
MKPRKLKDIDTEEISLVDRAANLKSFSITKRRMTMKFLDTLKKFLGGDLSKEQIQKVSDIPPDAAIEITGAIAVLKRYMEDQPEDFVDAIKTLVQLATVNSPMAKAADSDEEEEFDVKKVGARLSKLTKEQLTGLRDSLANFIKEAGSLKAATKILDELLAEPAAAEDVKKYAEGLTAEIFVKKMKRLDELEALAKEPSLKKTDVEAMIAKALEKAPKKPVKKSLNVGDEEEEGDEAKPKPGDSKYEASVKKAGGPLWPSLTGKEEE